MDREGGTTLHGGELQPYSHRYRQGASIPGRNGGNDFETYTTGVPLPALPS